MFNVPSFDDIRDAVLRDTQSLDPSADISPDSDHYVHASRLAACASGQYAHQVWIARQIFPDTADTAYLERHAALRGLTRRRATVAMGRVQIRGEAGARVAAGLQLKCGSRFYRTRAEVQVAPSGTAQAEIEADEAGAAGNVLNAAAQFMAAPAGVATECVLTAEGGTDAEDDTSLLNRLLAIIRRPPAGGNRYDYQNWALSVDGVTSAYVYPLRRGLGTVDIAVTSGNAAPSDEVVARTQAYIDSVRPVTAKNVLVLKPSITLVDVDVRVKLAGVDLPAARAAVQAALNDYFDALSPADGLVVSQIEAAVSNVEGVTDRRLLSPAANRTADTASRIEWFKLGSLNVGLLA